MGNSGMLSRVAAAAIVFATSAQSQAVAVTAGMVAAKAGFSFPAEGNVRIVLFRPDIEVSELTAGGVEAPNADWASQARSNLMAAVAKSISIDKASINPIPDLQGDDNRMVVDYRLLLKAVVRSAFAHRLASEDRLPTKMGKFAWTLGPGANRLGAIGDGEYGLFLSSEDSFRSTESNAVRVVGALLGAEQQVEKHMGYAGLVDLKTGDLVWLNVDPIMHGDVRTPDGADRRVAELLQKFPKRGAAISSGADR